MKDFPDITFTLNGGITTIDDIQKHLNNGVHSVMIGRAAYENPWMLSEIDSKFFGEPAVHRTKIDVVKEYPLYKQPNAELFHDTQSMPNECRRTSMLIRTF